MKKTMTRRKEPSEDAAAALAELIRLGLVTDSGMRRGGRIVWITVPQDDKKKH